MNRRLCFVLTVLAVLGATVRGHDGLSASASSVLSTNENHSDDDASLGAPLDAHASLGADAALYAKASGVSFDEAKTRLDLQPSIAQSALTDAGPPYAVEVRTGSFVPFEELRKVQSQLLSSLAQFYVAGTYIDVTTNSVVVQLHPDSPNQLRIRETEEELAARFSTKVRFEVLPSPANDDAVYGGLAVGGCTTAFAVSNYSGTTGFLTSAHCGDLSGCSLLYNFSLSSCWRNSSWGPSTDVQWRSVFGHPGSPQFWDGTSYRSVFGADGYSYQYVGMYDCHYGRGTGYSCGQVSSKTYKPNYPGDPCNGSTCASNWILVSPYNWGLVCGDGDSGGPWFVGGTAYGVNKGSLGSNCVYMPIDRITYMSVFVLTQ